jgi:chemotaxis protein MotA
MAYRKSELSAMPKSALKAMNGKAPDVQATITVLAQLADTARRDGMLALEMKLEDIKDRFVQLGGQLLVDDRVIGYASSPSRTTAVPVAPHAALARRFHPASGRADRLQSSRRTGDGAH